MRAKPAILIILLALILNACSFGGGNNTPTPAPTNTAIPLPTLTATPVTPLAILVVPEGMDKATSDAYQKVVYDLAQGSGLRFQVRNSMTPADLEPGLKVVVALPPDPGIAALAAAAPQVQFLAVNIPGISAAGNISVLGSTSQVDMPAFIAGYTAAMISDEYHTGMIAPKGNPDAQKAEAAFTNGMAFYCGLCRPFYYLPYTYPQFIEIPSDEDKSHYPAYADFLIVQKKVYTLYVYPDIAIKELMDYLSTTGTQLIGVSLPDPKPSSWVMTIRPDEVKAIENSWPNLLAGQGGQTVQSPLGLSDVDP
ncbi:MAG TPA: hypothetical protein VHM28_09385, partial [Anaerolineales bacterium]|nr:hypothetical protein [Anaerolineales bacterium]